MSYLNKDLVLVRMTSTVVHEHGVLNRGQIAELSPENANEYVARGWAEHIIVSRRPGLIERAEKNFIEETTDASRPFQHIGRN